MQQSMNAAKTNFAAVPAETLQDFTQFAAGGGGAGDADVQPAAHRGSDESAVQPDHLERARAERTAVLGRRQARALLPGERDRRRSGLNMTVQSYNGNLDFGFIGCRELVPDLWTMTDLLHESMQELLDLC
ncbi:MAG: WS/DGAT domain-containing protein [Ilumatobacteraceae bacterium]